MPTDTFAVELKSYVFGLLEQPVPSPCNILQLEQALYQVIKTKVEETVRANKQDAAFRRAILTAATNNSVVHHSTISAIDTLVSEGFEDGN